MTAWSTTRFETRSEPYGWAVYDLFTGWPATIADVPQTEMDLEDALEAAELLNFMSSRRQPLQVARPRDR